MTDFKRMADEYAAPGRVEGTEAIRRRAFLAGVDAALEAAAQHTAGASTAINYMPKSATGEMVDYITRRDFKIAATIRAMKVKQP